MELYAESLFHIYNQGNRKQRIFFDDSNYELFQELTKRFVHPHCDILAYCLMPNHFHFLINASPKSVEKIQLGSIELTVLSNSFRLLLSNYAQIVNRERDESGSLFRQKTKAKWLDHTEEKYAITCFNYVHMNPVTSGLVKNPEDWKYSSCKAYVKSIDDVLINKNIAKILLDL